MISMILCRGTYHRKYLDTLLVVSSTYRASRGIGESACICRITCIRIRAGRSFSSSLFLFSRFISHYFRILTWFPSYIHTLCPWVRNCIVSWSSKTGLCSLSSTVRRCSERRDLRSAAEWIACGTISQQSQSGRWRWSFPNPWHDRADKLPCSGLLGYISSSVSWNLYS